MIKCYHRINYFSIYFIKLIMKYIIHRGITSKNIKENSYLAIKKAIKDVKKYYGYSYNYDKICSNMIEDDKKIDI